MQSQFQDQLLGRAHGLFVEDIVDVQAACEQGVAPEKTASFAASVLALSLRNYAAAERLDEGLQLAGISLTSPTEAGSGITAPVTSNEQVAAKQNTDADAGGVQEPLGYHFRKVLDAATTALVEEGRTAAALQLLFDQQRTTVPAPVSVTTWTKVVQSVVRRKAIADGQSAVMLAKAIESVVPSSARTPAFYNGLLQLAGLETAKRFQFFSYAIGQSASHRMRADVQFGQRQHQGLVGRMRALGEVASDANNKTGHPASHNKGPDANTVRILLQSVQEPGELNGVLEALFPSRWVRNECPSAQLPCHFLCFFFLAIWPLWASAQLG